MSWYNRTKYDCRNTTKRIERRQNGSIGIIDSISMHTHLVSCPLCRLYKEQTKMLHYLLQKEFVEDRTVTLDMAFKERLEQMINDRLSKRDS